MSEQLLSSPAVLGPDGTLRPGWLLLHDGAVHRRGDGAPPGTPDLEPGYLAPGFVDVHCHGGGGAAFATTDPGQALLAAQFHGAHGSAHVMASLVTASMDELEAQVRALVPLAREGSIAGIHLEGPWLSPEHAGAHDPELLARPRTEDVDRLLTAAEGHLRMVTLAPELPGSPAAIERLVSRGVTVAVGHTDVDEDGLRAAVTAGARVVTHLGNAMRPIHHRAPGPVPAALADERIGVELIADGVHVHPEVLALFARAARSRILLVTDATPAAGRPDGRYLLGRLPVEVRQGVARLDGGALAGSTLTMDRAVRTAVAAGIPVADALASATRLPARAVGMAGTAGLLVPGARGVLALDEDLQIIPR